MLTIDISEKLNFCDILPQQFLIIKVMKRPSNLIIAFILIIAATFVAYAMGRILLRVFEPTNIELEQNIESQKYQP